MARVTVEDCVEKVPNRFDLVMLAAQRARDISAGAALTLDRDRDKNPVVALREIAAEAVPFEDLSESLVRGHQKHLVQEEAEDEVIELMAGEEEWLAKGIANPDEAGVGVTGADAIETAEEMDQVIADAGGAAPGGDLYADEVIDDD